MSGICIPCYELLYKLIPDTEPLLSGCKTNLQTWKQIAAEKIKEASKIKEEDGEETDTGIEEVNEEEEGEETVEEIDDECIDGKDVTRKGDDT